ncbi:MAG TPA: threonine--tRNA ligase [Oligoflexia bacterium]|nr:threonine--tRNA ligase [Oligoflexia bacterium]HMP48598.1 threonine--tRNA ligase [Oligoflexia bacterium]
MEINVENKVVVNVKNGMLVSDLLANFSDHLSSKKTPIAIVLGEKTILDLQTPIDSSILSALNDNAKLDSKPLVRILYLEDDSREVRLIYRHSFSHILAQAVERLYPGTRFAIGPAIDNGFYYDFDVSEPFTPQDLDKISDEMKKIVKDDYPFVRREMSYEEAHELLSKKGERYKLELLSEIRDRGESISFYQDGDFLDMCAGPHIPSTKAVRNFKLLDVAGAYWRGNEKNKMLQRIYGTAFLDKQDMLSYVNQLEEAKKRDHRRLGKDLDLFSIHPDTVGGGLILWHPKGGLVRYLVEQHCRERHLESGYDFVFSPHVGRSILWQTSGHLEFYKEGMYSPIDIEGQEYYLKPMNCPFHVQIFASQKRSYRELPIRYAEWGTVYRFERSGTLHGLTRVRGFTQDDAHLFCRPDQMPDEIDRVLDFSVGLLRDFSFSDFSIKLSTRPEERVGDESRWDAAELALRQALERSGIDYSINEGDGAFYGPKIDLCVKDAVGREWQLSTIQFDFNLPERFDISYVGEDGKNHRPYMLHRALLGSMERFFGVLIEHYAGAFPVWLSPEQVRVLPVGEKHGGFADEIKEFLREAKVRVSVDNSSNTLSYRVRAAQKEKIPFVFVIGDKELEGRTVSIRKRGGEDLGVKGLDEVKKWLVDMIEGRVC